MEGGGRYYYGQEEKRQRTGVKVGLTLLINAGTSCMSTKNESERDKSEKKNGEGKYDRKHWSEGGINVFQLWQSWTYLLVVTLEHCDP